MLRQQLRPSGLSRSYLTFTDWQIMMSSFSARWFLTCLYLTLILIGVNHTVLAQTLPNSAPPLGDSKPDQPSTPSSNQRSGDSNQLRLRNYIGIGGNIGVSGRKTGLSQGGVSIITKNDLTDWLSLRGVSVFGSRRSDNTFALTVNLPIRSRQGKVILVPFVGGGVLLSSKYNFDDFIVRGLVTGGIDMPLTRRFTATASVNVGFTDRTNTGVQLGIAYNF
jgi:hypothetical protein